MAGEAADRADRLSRYQEKRDFGRTEEPRGRNRRRKQGNRFVVQLHRARRRHFDLRLEIEGVLVSWAVPRGPTLDSSARRLAVRVEDHPLEYADFEGVIPDDEYGGGDVIVWDRGSWLAVDTDSAANAIEDGNPHFDLVGEKLSGRFVLVRHGADKSGKQQWLLLHKKDEYAVPGWEPESHPESVKTGRTNEDVAHRAGPVWHSDRGTTKTGRKLEPKKRKSRRRVPSWQAPTERELATLDALGSRGTWYIAGRELSLTNLNKALFPATQDDPAVTKRDLIRYYACVAPVMLPYLADRPLNTRRFPDGTGRPGFWHKEFPSHAPDWLSRWHYADAEADDTQWYVVADNVPALAWLANYAAIELHPWISRTGDVQRPSWALFDIDAGSTTSFDDVLALARLHRTALEHLGVTGRPKVSGQGGIQIWVPIQPRYTYAETREWTKKVSQAIGDAMPDLVSWAWRKDERKGRARLDYTQNVLHKTLVAPYSARPRPGAPVSVPLEWDELDDPELTPDRWTIHTVLERLETVGDPFASLLSVEQQLPAP